MSPMLEVWRWYCPCCAIVRDTVELDGEPFPPWCRHNALDVPAERMAPVQGWHPLAACPLPWGLTNPSRP